MIPHLVFYQLGLIALVWVFLMLSKSECMRFVHMLPGTAPELALVRRCQCPNVLHFDLGCGHRNLLQLAPGHPSR